MPSYLWSGRDGSGCETSERVTAGTPEEARDQLAARGWTELKLRSSEIHEFVKQEVEAVSDPAFRPQLTPQQEVALLQGTGPGFWGKWWNSLRESAFALLVVGCAFAAEVYRHKVSGVIICGCLLLALALLFPAIHFWFHRTSDLFHKLHRARNWRRWQEVLALLEALKRSHRSRKIGIGKVEMARYRALALAGLGNVEGAIAQFTKEADEAGMPRWLFHCHIAGIYTVAEKYESALECYKQGLEVATDKGVVSIDYGAYLVQRFNRPAEARAMLAIAESVPLTDSARFHVHSLRGLIAVREGDFVTAKEQMSAALDGFEKQPRARYFAYEPSILLAHGYLALIHAALGNRDAAQEHFSKSEKYLTTIRLNEVIDEYHSRIAAPVR